jgi:Na+/melibiose symporter-like transporter
MLVAGVRHRAGNGHDGHVQRLSWSGLAALSSLWLAWNAQWLTIAPILMPQAVAALVPAHPELWSGLTVGAGALVALLVTPVAGALSDRSRNPRGRRSRFLITGVMGSCVGLVALGWAVSANLIALAVVYLVLQFWWNWGGGPFAGLIPDIVAPDQHAAASGWLNALGIIGTILSSAAMFTYRPGHPWAVIALWIALSLVCLAVTVARVREPAPAPPPWPGLGSFARSFVLPLAENRNFYWVLVTRLLNNMGVWSVFTFLVLYLHFVVGLPETRATQLMSTLMGVGAVLAIAASLVTAWMIARVGVVRVVRQSSWVMALAAAGYAGAAFAPQLWLVVPLLLVFGLANGVFGAADWALALAVLPTGQDAGKDMGIWHVCLVLPQIIGPITTGVLITAIEHAASARAAYALAFAVAAAWFLAASIYVGKLQVAP